MYRAMYSPKSSPEGKFGNVLAASSARAMASTTEQVVSLSVESEEKNIGLWIALATLSRLIIRNPDARAMLAEICNDRDRELHLWDGNAFGRAWVNVCTAWAICWHLAVFKVLSSVTKLVERVFTRRA